MSSDDEDEASAHLVTAVRLAEAGATARATGDEKKAKKRYRKAVKQAAAVCTSGAAAAAALAEDLLTRVEHDASPTEELPELRVPVGSDDLSDEVDDAVTALAEGGVCLLEECVHVTEAGGMMQSAYITLDLVRAATRDQYGDDAHFSFKEAARRCKGRIDARLDASLDVEPWGMATKALRDYGAHLSNVLRPLIDRVLGEDAKLAYMGLVSSGPGSVAQPWHADGVPLFPGDNALPAHALNCFAPIVNVSRRMGPTEFVPASHKPGPVARALEAALQRGREPADVFSPELSVGDVLVYDQRTVHRGVPNRTTTERPILYLLFARPWFREHINFGETSLFERHVAAAAKKKKQKRRRVPE